MYLNYFLVGSVLIYSGIVAEEDILLERLCRSKEHHSDSVTPRKTCECLNESNSPWGLPSLQIDCSFKSLKSSFFPSDVLPLYSDSLDVSWNKLEYVPNFSSDSLKVLNLMHNNISELAENNFQQLTLLRELYVSWNAIHTISSNAFDNLKYLQVLDLSHNNIKQIASNVFSFLSALDTLDLSWNRQINNTKGILDPDVYSQFGINLKLRTLKMESCGLYDIRLPENAALNLLDIKNNNFGTIPQELPHSLKELDLSSNHLTSLLPSQTSKLTELEVLYFEDMPSLMSVEEEALTPLTNLKALSFQNCRHLTSFHAYAFGVKPSNRSLEVLTFRGAALRKFNQTLLPVFQNLTQLDLNGMPLNCDCEMVWIKDLKIETNGRCISPSKLRGIKLSNVQRKDFSCDTWPRWIYGCFILFTLILCSAGIFMIVMGLRPNRGVSMRRKLGSNSPYARVTIEPNRQENNYY